MTPAETGVRTPERVAPESSTLVVRPVGPNFFSSLCRRRPHSFVLVRCTQGKRYGLTEKPSSPKGWRRRTERNRWPRSSSRRTSSATSPARRPRPPGAPCARCWTTSSPENPQARSYVLDDQSALRKHMTIFVDGQMIRDRARLSDPVHRDQHDLRLPGPVRRLIDERHAPRFDPQGLVHGRAQRAGQWEIDGRRFPRRQRHASR